MTDTETDDRLKLLELDRQHSLPMDTIEPGRDWQTGEIQIGDDWIDRAEKATAKDGSEDCHRGRHYLCTDAAVLAIKRCIGKETSSLKVASVAVGILPEDANDFERGMAWAIAQLRWAQLRLHELADVDPA